MNFLKRSLRTVSLKATDLLYNSHQIFQRLNNMTCVLRLAASY